MRQSSDERSLVRAENLDLEPEPLHAARHEDRRQVFGRDDRALFAGFYFLDVLEQFGVVVSAEDEAAGIELVRVGDDLDGVVVALLADETALVRVGARHVECAAMLHGDGHTFLCC